MPPVPHTWPSSTGVADTICARKAEEAAAAMHDHLHWAAHVDLAGLGERAELRLFTPSVTG